MSAHPTPRATRSISAETARSSELALGPNQRGKAGGEVEASTPVMAMAHQRTRRRSAGEPILLDAGRSRHARAAWSRTKPAVWDRCCSARERSTLSLDPEWQIRCLTVGQIN